MAKKIPGATQSAASERIARTEAYAGKVKKMFDETVNDILKLKLAKPTEEGVMYSFDGDSLQVRKQVEYYLKRLHASATLAVKKGIQAEWSIANREMDNLVKATFGKKLFESDRFRAWTAHNEDAMNAFVNRTDKGMNLSDRVWKASRQLRDEMEVALTVGMGSGESAASMSRAVRQCLNDPDLMFRRFRYKKGEDADGNPVYGRKWKKKVIEDGKTKWIDYDKDSYIPKGAGEHSRGVYRSAAKNAMRVARTETNMAYRRADYERWQKMDFVLGIRIEMSNQHPRPDICDEMQGDYPKTFYFSGFHPFCFCYATPILVSEDEMAKVTEEFMEGRTYVPKGEPILDTPPAFKQWVADNSDRIRNASSLPYWIKDNPQFVDARKGVALTPDPKTIKAEIAKEGVAATVKKDEPKEVDNFISSKTIDEAQNYAKKLISDSIPAHLRRFMDEPVVDFAQISIESANEINRALQELSQYGVSLPSSVVADIKRFKTGAAQRANAGMVGDVLYINPKFMKTPETLVKRKKSDTINAKKIYTEEGAEMSAFTKRMKEAWENSGRTSMSSSIGDVIVHEFGHRIDNMKLTDAMREALYKGFEEYGRKISVYAAYKEKEYFAESFLAYHRGENIIDPELRKYFDSLRTKQASEKVGGNKAHRYGDGNFSKKVTLDSEETKAIYELPENKKPLVLSESQEENIKMAARKLSIPLGEPKEHYQADSGEVNKGGGVSHKENCVACSFTYELRRRGLNVTSKPYTTPSKDNPLYIAGESFERGKCQGYGVLFNGIEPVMAIASKNLSVISSLEKITRAKGRYHLSWDWNEDEGHSIVAERLADNTLVLYDGQHNCYYSTNVFDRVKEIEVYRVDNAIINLDVLKDMVDIIVYKKKAKRK